MALSLYKSSNTPAYASCILSTAETISSFVFSILKVFKPETCSSLYDDINFKADVFLHPFLFLGVFQDNLLLYPPLLKACIN